MKKFISIFSIIILFQSFSGFQICIDYCCEQIKSIHFSESQNHQSDGCCSEKESSCCTEQTVVKEQILLDYTFSCSVQLPCNFFLNELPDYSIVLPTVFENIISYNTNIPPPDNAEKQSKLQVFLC
ncbi:MAG: hypothetical protein H6607_05530 [Flavobacteriales bacterium]|nr:hypothetical protein [Flavobacteriales bacterium]